MSPTVAHSMSVLVIDSEPSAVIAIKDFLAGQGIRSVTETDHAGALDAARECRPDLVLIEVTAGGDPALELVRQIRSEFPQAGIFVSSAESTPDLILRSMRAGAQEFLGRPVNADELTQALERITGFLRIATPPRREGGQVIAVFCTKGGVGVSSLATNAAVVLSRKKLRTALVDLDFQSGDLELMLNIRPTSTISDIAAGVIHEPRVRSSLATHSSGVCLLGAPRRLEDAEAITPGHLTEIFEVLKAMFDEVVVDAGHTLDDRTLEVLDIADRVIIPILLNVPTVRAVSRALELFHKLGFPADKPLLVVNRDQKRTKIRVSDVEQTLGRNVFCTLPNDYHNMMRSIDVGVPVVLEAARSPIARSFEALGNRVTDPVGYTARPDRETGFFGRKRPLVANR